MATQKSVVFIINPQGYHHAFKSLEGMLGQHIRKLTEIARATAVVEAPHPGGPPHGLSGLNYSTGELASKIRTSYGHWHGPTGSEIEGTVKSGAHHTVFVVEGTRPHVIKPKKASGLLYFKWARAGGRSVAFRHVNHPGQRADDFLNRALRKAV